MASQQSDFTITAASSAPTNSGRQKRKRHLTDAERERLCQAVLSQRGRSMAAIAKDFGVSKTTAYRIVNTFAVESRMHALPHGGSQKLLQEADVNWLKREYLKDPYMTLEQAAERLRERTGRLFAKQTISNRLCGAGWRMKNVTAQPIARDSAETRDKRVAYWRDFWSHIALTQAFFVDEFGINIKQRPKRGRGAPARPIIDYLPRPTSTRDNRNLTVCAMMGLAGVLQKTVHFGSFRGTDFAAFIDRCAACISERYPDRMDMKIIVDNASIHRVAAVAETLEKYPRVHLVKLPPYSPMLNGIEECFSKIKGITRRLSAQHNTTDHRGLVANLNDAVKRVTPDDCSGWMNHIQEWEQPILERKPLARIYTREWRRYTQRYRRPYDVEDWLQPSSSDDGLDRDESAAQSDAIDNNE